MGSKQSALRKEIDNLRHEARNKAAKQEEELATISKEKRLLQLKVDELQETVTKTQLEIEKAKSEAQQQEERMKALKWELVRQLKLSGSRTSGSNRSLLSSTTLSSPRIALNWKLNDDVVLRQSIASPKKSEKTAPASESKSIRVEENCPVTVARIPNPNQAADTKTKTKQVNNRIELTLKPTGSLESLSDSKDSSDESLNPEHAKDGMGAKDDEDKTEPRTKNGKSKNREDNPETNDVLSFSDSDQSSS